jgi:transcriptional regulator with XRE-family HTH domain
LRESRQFEMTSQKVAPYNTALKVAIIDSGKTQRQVARRARIDETRFSRIITGQVAPFPIERERLAKILKKTELELFPAPAAQAKAS